MFATLRGTTDQEDAMASPEAIFTVYDLLAESAQTIRDFQVAKGEKVSGTVNLILKGDRAKLLARWLDEMEELVGVLNGVHDDPYIVESTQCFYWASVFTVTGGLSWADIEFEAMRQKAATEQTLQDPNMIISQAQRLAAMEPDQVKPAKLFLLWWAADNVYRHSDRFKDRWEVDQIMEYDLQDMKKREYLQPILKQLGLL